ncbi:hypothetical protein ABT127_30205 [Streptomyces sp. NPDC001904]|uniref:hypothetical protein n=1 Tax=Streptomyces sp. NPDC001904 TaxID=3154531 RepID=UPI00333015F8
MRQVQVALNLGTGEYERAGQPAVREDQSAVDLSRVGDQAGQQAVMKGQFAELGTSQDRSFCEVAVRQGDGCGDVSELQVQCARDGRTAQSQPGPFTWAGLGTGAKEQGHDALGANGGAGSSRRFRANVDVVTLSVGVPQLAFSGAEFFELHDRRSLQRRRPPVQTPRHAWAAEVFWALLLVLWRRWAPLSSMAGRRHRLNMSSGVVSSVATRAPATSVPYTTATSPLTKSSPQT